MSNLIRDAFKSVGSVAGSLAGLVVAAPIVVIETAVNGGNEPKVADAIFLGLTAVGEIVGEVTGEVAACIPAAIAREVVRDALNDQS